MIKSKRANAASIPVSRSGELHQRQHMRTSHWIIIAVLLGLLAIVVWYGVNVWTSTPSMPTYGYVAMGLGAVVAIAVGVGLMALMFHSNRSGYDDAAHNDRRLRK
jgi:hypothetical protein